MKPLRRSGSWLCWLILAVLGSLGASDPEVVKIRVPAGKVSSWFPPGSNLQVLPADRFEELLQAVRDRPSPRAGARLLRARHSARWESGMLMGRSELTVATPDDSVTDLVVLDPWSPALMGQGVGSEWLRVSMDGRLGIKISSTGPTRIEPEWRLRARPGSDGRTFALALPELALSSLTLDLPQGLEPEANAGPRIGPEAGPTPGRSIWRFEAARGRIDLSLRAPIQDAKQTTGPSLWLEGSTRIDLNLSPANWRADWTLDSGPGAPRQLTIELDRGLEVLEVKGPRVASFRVEDGRLAIKLKEEVSGQSPLTILALCAVPAEGPWAVSSARPLNAIWTGGRTIVRLDESRVLQTCREKAGRRVATRTGDPVNLPTLVFEPNGEPGPVAELTFRKPMAEATIDVRGLLRLGNESPRIEVALTWTVERGRVLSRAVDLAPGWTPDRVLSASGQPVAWNAERLSNGRIRVHVSSSSNDDSARVLTLTLFASAPDAGATGPLDLPRVRPTPGIRVVDEIWAATPDPSLTLRPILGRGVAWIDPPDPPPDEIPTPWVADDLRNALTWRWLSDDAEARIDRSPPLDHPRGEVKLDATVKSGRIKLEWTLVVDSSRGDLRSVPIHLDHPPKAPIRWRSRDVGGPTVEAHPIGDVRRAALGFPATGASFELEISGPSRGRVQIEGLCESTWSGTGEVPLLTLPDRYRTRGLVAIKVEDSARTTFDSIGLTPIDPSLGVRDPSVQGEAATLGSTARIRLAGMFSYRTSDGRLRLMTDRAQIDPRGGLVREAFLISQVFPGTGARHRLTLKVAVDTARDLEIKMQPGARVDRLRRDGLPVVATTSGDSLRLEIPEPTPGRSTCTVTVDYRTEDNGRPGRLEASRFLPECSLPCLSFAWELMTPEPWSVGDITPGLFETDLRPDRSVVLKILGFHWFPWATSDGAATANVRDAMSRDLEKTASDIIITSETSLGDWLLKLDSGRWPIVIDRLAMRSAGWGPGSRINPVSPESKSLGPIRAILQPMGLTALPLDGMILVTARSDAPERSTDRSTWSARLRDVPAQGSDLTDRFQSAGRWRGESTPRALSAGEALDRSPGLGGWHSSRLVSVGWPSSGASLSLVNSRSDQAIGWVVALAVLAAGIGVRKKSSIIRGIGLATLAAIATIGLAWTWPEPWTVFTGLVRGVLAVQAFWVGQAFRNSLAVIPASASQISTTSRRSSFIAGMGAAPLALILLGLGSMSSLANLAADGPILALLPFDGPPDPASKPDRVVLLLDDFNRLRELARHEEPGKPMSVGLSAASHRVVRQRAGMVMVESLYQVEVEGDGPASWSLPVGTSIDLSATLDDRPTPLRIAADGLSANVVIDGSGSHRLVFRRSVSLTKIGQGGESAVVPINRAAFARVTVAKGSEARRVEVPTATGVLEMKAEGIEGVLGPAGRLEVQWMPGDQSTSSGFRGPVEATCLWDARSVGDLVRLRLTHSDPDGASTIRLVLEPGLLVRRYSIPNVVGVRLEGTPERPEWAAHLDPPLPRDQLIEIDLWRKSDSRTTVRRCPLVEIPTKGRFSGMLGFRRPSDWSGRLEPQAGIEPVIEASFVKNWGELPDDGMTLAGAVRFGPSPTLEVSSRPIPLRRSVRSKVQVDLAPGRLQFLIEATLSDRQGRSFGMEMDLPGDARVTKVEADGLLGWQKVARDRLRLQFNGSEVPDRLIRVEGHLPVPADSVMSETRSYQARIPWPGWVDAEVLPGSLVISSPTRFQFEGGDGVVPRPNVGPINSDPLIRASFQIDRPSGLSPIHWSAPPAKVGVSVQSDLTIDPGHLTWTAAITCDITGGPADALHWNLPTEWTNGATLEIEGVSHRIVAEPKGTKGEVTLWTILPDAPLWGRSRMVLRARRPLKPGVQFTYPELTPLAAIGRGSVESYDLAIANVSGRPMELAGSTGLQPIEVSRFRGEESPSPPGSIDHAYHVTGERWWLRVRVGRDGDKLMASRERETTRVSWTQLSCALNSDGELSGRARYDLEPRPGPFLAVRLDAPALILWASVDGVIGPALRDGEGRWLVPLGNREARQVIFFWRDPGPGRKQGGGGSLICPTVDQSDVPTLISMTSPPMSDIQGASGSVDRLERFDWEAESAERLGRQITGALTDLDRSSRRDRDLMVDALIEIELKERNLTRALSLPSRPVEASLLRIQSALTTIDEASQAMGLEDLVQEARARIGLAQEFEDETSEPRFDVAEQVRTPRVGPTHFFRSLKNRPGGPSPITWTRKAPPSRSSSPESWTIVLCGVLAALSLGAWIARPWVPKGRVANASMIFAILLFLACEPSGMAAALGLAAWGRISS